MDKKTAYIALNLAPKLGPIKTRQLLHYLGSIENIFQASATTLQQVPGIGPKIAQGLHSSYLIQRAEKEIENCNQRGIQIITQDDETYPEPLTHYDDAPMLLYVWGELTPADNHAIAVVGTRAATPYGKQITKEFSYQLASCGNTIISGLARGIDTHAHEAAIAANGRTIAVLGSGLAQLYPPENLPLAHKIASGYGAVVSEFPLNSPPDRQSFPMRNRIVASWCHSLLVTESPEKSGSLITANMAGEKGKQVFAVPGPINRPHSSGCHELIRQGATLVTSVQQMIDEENWFPSQDTHSAQNSGNQNHGVTTPQAAILELLTTPMNADDIASLLKQPIDETLCILTELELDERIQQDQGGIYSLNT